MSTATIKRGGTRGGRLGTAGRAAGRPRRGPGPVDRLIGYLPLSQAQLARGLTWAIGTIVAALLWLAASFFGLPAMLGAEVSELAGRAGFAVAKIEVRGLERMEEAPVSDIAVKYVDRSMLSVDLDSLRAEIMTLGWVKEARVSRRLPDALVVQVIERQPVAVWQHDGRLSLIDTSGIVLGSVDPEAIPDLPLVVGPEANMRTEALARLMDAAPALKPMLAGATWVGNRRWNLRFQSGEQLLLPEGDAEAAAALVNFARMDGVDRLLGRGVLRFDMRDPGRFVLRLPPGQSEADAPAVTSAPTQTQTVVSGGAKQKDEAGPTRAPAAERTEG
jgi:cell division protein FtsQ